MNYKEIFYEEVWPSKKFKLKFRYDPVPYTGDFKGYGVYLRKIKTTQEKRYSCDPEHKPYIRGKRTCRNLPEAWDDIPVSLYLNKRSWKRIKKRKQWM